MAGLEASGAARERKQILADDATGTGAPHAAIDVAGLNPLAELGEVVRTKPKHFHQASGGPCVDAIQKLAGQELGLVVGVGHRRTPVPIYGSHSTIRKNDFSYRFLLGNSWLDLKYRIMPLA
jgi:hypothetical protein